MLYPSVFHYTHFFSSASTSPLPIPSLPSCLSCPLLVISLPFPVSPLALMTPLHYSLASPTCTPNNAVNLFSPVSCRPDTLPVLHSFLSSLPSCCFPSPSPPPPPLFSVTCFPFLSAFPQSSFCIFPDQILSSKVLSKKAFLVPVNLLLSEKYPRYHKKYSHFPMYIK